MFCNFLSRRWKKDSEYKKVLQQLRSHLNQLKSKKQSVSRILRGEITQLIENNDQARALVRTKELVVLKNWISVYQLLLYFTDVILLKFDRSIRNQRFGKELLDDKINEAVSSLVFASTRCGEELLQPWLLSIREIFGQRYGQIYVSTALELRHGNFVNLKIKEKLSKGSEEKSELEEETSMEDENIEDAQNEKEEEGERRRRPLSKHVHPSLPEYDEIVAKLIKAKNEDEEERRRRLSPKYVHPKLPDYDQIVVKFKALRT